MVQRDCWLVSSADHLCWSTTSSPLHCSLYGSFSQSRLYTRCLWVYYQVSACSIRLAWCCCHSSFQSSKASAKRVEDIDQWLCQRLANWYMYHGDLTTDSVKMTALCCLKSFIALLGLQSQLGVGGISSFTVSKSNPNNTVELERLCSMIVVPVIVWHIGELYRAISRTSSLKHPSQWSDYSINIRFCVTLQCKHYIPT